MGSPFGPKVFRYHVGSMHLEYDAESGFIKLSMPGAGSRIISLEHLKPNQSFAWTAGPGPSTAPWPSQSCDAAQSGTATSNKDGVLSFKTIIGDQHGPCVIAVKAEEAVPLLV